MRTYHPSQVRVAAGDVGMVDGSNRKKRIKGNLRNASTRTTRTTVVAGLPEGIVRIIGKDGTTRYAQLKRTSKRSAHKRYVDHTRKAPEVARMGQSRYKMDWDS